MNKFITSAFLLLIIFASAYYTYHYFITLGLSMSSNETKFACMTFVMGLSLALLFSEFIINKINTTLSAYKRELEKESIDSTESSSKIKVLESKIAVLEKALEDALKK